MLLCGAISITRIKHSLIGISHQHVLSYNSTFIMAKHLNPLEKEFLIHQFKRDPATKTSDFCEAHQISASAFRNWMKQYEEFGLDGLARADAEIGSVLSEGVDPTEEAYRREILKLRIENERLKKIYIVRTNEDVEQEYIRLKAKNPK